MIDTVIVLAAGQGTRLRPLTENLPKGMVPLHGRPLLAWQLDAIRAAGAKKIVVVSGYEADKMDLASVQMVHNPRFASTNMIASLLCAREHFGSGFVLAYADIVYKPEVLRAVLASQADVGCAVDDQWENYWRQRFGDPLLDAETLRLTGERITEIGQPPKSLSEIEAQFVGLVGFQGKGINQLLEVTERAVKLAKSGSTLPGCPRNMDALYTTDVLQELIRKGCEPRAVRVKGGWLEIDDLADHKLAEKLSEASEAGLTLKR